MRAALPPPHEIEIFLRIDVTDVFSGRLSAQSYPLLRSWLNPGSGHAPSNRSGGLFASIDQLIAIELMFCLPFRWPGFFTEIHRRLRRRVWLPSEAMESLK
jgi:hypothetical protein